jgi:hypothetical protein
MARQHPLATYGRGGYVPPPPSRHLWWALSPVYTCGLIAFVPAIHAAAKLRRRELWWWAVGLVAADVLAWALISAGPSADDESSVLQSIGTVLVLATAVVGTVHALRMRDEVFAPPPAPAPVDPSIARSLAARERRAESVALCRRDPGLARDLRIGRPDLPRDYDDGGLVDVNHVPAAVLVSHLGLTESEARGVVAARDHLGLFLDVDDLENLAEISPRTLDAIRDRVVVL